MDKPCSVCGAQTSITGESSGKCCVCVCVMVILIAKCALELANL